MTEKLHNVEAAILAGGSSMRMGKHKALLSWKNITFLEHLVLQLQREVACVRVLGCPERDLYQHVNCVLCDDLYPDCGPLGGIATAMQTMTSEWLVVVPCDNPVLPECFARDLLAMAMQASSPLVYLRKAGREQPLYAILNAQLLHPLQTYLQRGGRKVLEWYASVGGVAFEAVEPGAAFDNLNTPEAYAAFIAKNTHP